MNAGLWTFSVVIAFVSGVITGLVTAEKTPAFEDVDFPAIRNQSPRYNTSFCGKCHSATGRVSSGDASVFYCDCPGKEIDDAIRELKQCRNTRGKDLRVRL